MTLVSSFYRCWWVDFRINSSGKDLGVVDSSVNSQKNPIFVDDSCDTEERLEEAKLELHRIMRTPHNTGVPLLIIANKQDLPSAKSQNEIEKCLGMSDFSNDHLWHIEPACAVTGEGLESALEALHTLILKRKQQKKRQRNKTR